MMRWSLLLPSSSSFSSLRSTVSSSKVSSRSYACCSSAFSHLGWTTTTTTTLTASSSSPVHQPPSSLLLQQQQHLQQQIRWKHSARALRLKHINHPAVYRRRRREERQAQALEFLDEDDDDDDEAKSNVDENDMQEVKVGSVSRHHRATIRVKPRFAPWFTPEFLPNGWSAPPSSSLTTAATAATTPTEVTYPFSIRRTMNKPHGAVGFLPVYSHRCNGGSKVTTRIKKVQGNVDEMIEELQAVLYQHQVQQQQQRKHALLQPLEFEELPPQDNDDDHLLKQVTATFNKGHTKRTLPPIRIRAQGNTIEVDGNHVRTIKTWLAGLGF